MKSSRWTICRQAKVNISSYPYNARQRRNTNNHVNIPDFESEASTSGQNTQSSDEESDECPTSVKEGEVRCDLESVKVDDGTLILLHLYPRIKPKRRIYDSVGDNHSDSSESSTVKLESSSRKVPDPPPVPVLSPLKRSKAFYTPQQDKLDNSPSNTFIEEKDLLRAFARCETRIEDQNRLMEKMMTLQKDILHQLQHMRQGTSSTSSRQFDFAPLDALLPIETLDAFDTLEEKITLNKEFKELLVQQLDILGGSSVKDAVKAIIDTTMTNRLQQNFNWEGKKCWRTKEHFTKRGFKSTKLCRLVMDVLLKKPQLSTDESEIGLTIMKYLCSSSDRCGCRSQRSRTEDQNSSFETEPSAQS